MEEPQAGRVVSRPIGTATQPIWLKDLLSLSRVPSEGETIVVRGLQMVMRDGILRSESVVSESQGQTEKTFGFKWHQRETFERDGLLAKVRAWLIERYGDLAKAGWMKDYGDHPLILDAGCGAAMSALELFGNVLERAHYLGTDISDAVDVAAARCAERGISAGFLQADLGQLPLSPGSVDVIFSEGVLHHTDSTERAFYALAEFLKPGGRFLLYVYRKKGPMREFTDDYIRHQLQALTPQEAWTAVMPLTKLGKVLGELNIEIEVPEAIELLEIPAGKINLQRFFYWNLFKAFYRSDMTLDEMNHINFDWYAPRNAHRHTIEEVRGWCAEAGFTIERERVEEAGITVIARKKSS
jgi:SAM-dependent methyltransferase